MRQSRLWPGLEGLFHGAPTPTGSLHGLTNTLAPSSNKTKMREGLPVLSLTESVNCLVPRSSPGSYEHLLVPFLCCLRLGLCCVHVSGGVCPHSGSATRCAPSRAWSSPTQTPRGRSRLYRHLPLPPAFLPGWLLRSGSSPGIAPASGSKGGGAGQKASLPLGHPHPLFAPALSRVHHHSTDRGIAAPHSGAGRPVCGLHVGVLPRAGLRGVLGQ